MTRPLDRRATAPRVCGVAYTHYASDPRVRRESEALARRGADVTVLALAAGDRATTTMHGDVRVVELPVARYRGGEAGAYLRSYLAFFARAGAHLSRHPRRYDLVHVHSIPEALVFAALLPRLAGRPVLLDVHDLSTELYASRLGQAPAPVRWAEKASLRFAAHVVTVHDQYRDMLIERGVRPDRASVVLNVPDDRLFGPLRPPRRRDHDGLRLVYHGTILKRYGLEVALRAVACLRERIPGLTLDIYGDGDYRDATVALRDELGLADVVRLSDGAVPVDRIPDLIAGADVGLVPFDADPSTESILPTKLLEYALMGIPTVVSRNAVVERYFDEDMVSYMRPGSVDDLVAAVEALWRAPEEAVEQAARAQRFFATNSWKQQEDALWSVVEALVDR